MGIRSCIGNTYSEVLKNLQAGKSGITKNETYSKMNKIVNFPSLKN